MCIRSLSLAAMCALVLTGCEPPVARSTAAQGPPGPPPPPAPVAPPVEARASAGPVESAPAGFVGDGASADAASDVNALPVSAPASTAVPTSVPAADRGGEPFISLSAGVALPQSLPEGTQIGVSVDYSLRGEPRTSCRYLLVVESKEGEIPVTVKLDPRGGTFQGFLPLAVRPEHQPFRARIDELSPNGKRTRVSNSAVLATSY